MTNARPDRPDRPDRTAELQRWIRLTQLPLLLLALAFLVAFAWPILDPRLSGDVRTVLEVTSYAVWVAFAVDFAVRLWLADDRFRYARTHWYDVALIVAPVLRPLALLRLLAFARIVQRSAAGGLAGRVAIYVAGSAVFSVGLGALGVLQAERGAPGSNIHDIGDALWWACETVSTVGYGDFYPVTTTGRVVAVVLMVVGIAVVGSLTAVVASRLVEAVREESEATQARGQAERQG